MSFLWPWALAGAVLVPVLLGIYYLRQRARRRMVPSLLLWAQQTPRQASGRRWQTLETSRLLILELLLLALLILSAMGPWLPTEGAAFPLVVVLDDSLSMAAGDDESPLIQGREALQRELRQGRYGEVHWLLAGSEPRRLEVAGGLASGNQLPEAWQGRAAAADLERGLELARDVGGPEGHILVITDHLPDVDVAAPGLRWWAFGEARGNVAWVGASRRPGTSEDHVLVEVQNFSPEPVMRSLELTAVSADGTTLDGVDLARLAPDRLELEPGERRLLRWRVPRTLGLGVRLKGGMDAMEVDDGIVLLPTDPSPVRVRLHLQPGAVRDLLRRTLVSSGVAHLVNDDDAPVDLEVWGPGGAPGETSEAPWTVVLGVGAGKSRPFVGPFVLDTQHALAEGLALEGVVWSAGAADSTAGTVAGLPTAARAVVSAGDIPLLIDHGPGSGGTRRIDLRWQADLSNLQRTPNWPILWWNLLEACRQQRPGVEPRNGRLGSAVRFRPHPQDTSVRLLLPGGERRSLPVDGASPSGLEVPAEQLGLHRLEADDVTYGFVVNALAPGESDLRRAASDRLGSRHRERGARGRHSLLPYGILLALALSALHLAWSGGRRRAHADGKGPGGRAA